MALHRVMWSDGVLGHSNGVRRDCRVRLGDMELWVSEFYMVGAGIPEFWGHMAVDRSVMGAGRVRECQGRVGVWFTQGCGSHAAMGSHTHRVMWSSWGLAHVGSWIVAPPLGYRDPQSHLRKK